ncbi:MAG: NYN domain-containing protein [Acidobacteriia bacterium]|nr:NYN domain-containing protein [Terriglobia bacterium]
MDYWNLQLTLNNREDSATGKTNSRFLVNWKELPAWLARKAAETVGLKNYSFEGAIIFASYDPKTEEGRKFNSWATNWLNRQPGIQVQCHARQTRNAPRCNVCHRRITLCPHSDCGATLAGTVEKGVDTAIATDMIRLAWEDAYDIAVLSSSDADLVPAVKFLDQKGRKIIQAGFPPSGVHLATACWASFDIFASREEIRRP